MQLHLPSGACPTWEERRPFDGGVGAIKPVDFCEVTNNPKPGGVLWSLLADREFNTATDAEKKNLHIFGGMNEVAARHYLSAPRMRVRVARPRVRPAARPALWLLQRRQLLASPSPMLPVTCDMPLSFERRVPECVPPASLDARPGMRAPRCASWVGH